MSVSGFAGMLPEASAVPATGFAVAWDIAVVGGSTYSDAPCEASVGDVPASPDGGVCGEVALLFVSDSGVFDRCDGSGDFGS